jgi:broad-specificity NMP kinase
MITSQIGELVFFALLEWFYLLWAQMGYMGCKLQNNMECEIFQVLLEDAYEFYNLDIVQALLSNTIEDMSNNVEILSGLIRAWATT